jgi:hypothetical protein
MAEPDDVILPLLRDMTAMVASRVAVLRASRRRPAAGSSA